MPSSKKYGLNPEPRLSANQLAELVGASPTRRRSIIAAAKFPTTVRVARYKDAQNSLVPFLIDPARSQPDFSTQISALEAKAQDPALSKWKQQDAGGSAEALERVQNAYNATQLGKYDFRPLPAGKHPLDIEGVEVSVSLACQVRGTFKKQDAVGCMTILFAKTEQKASVRDERSKAAAVLGLLFAERYLTTDELVAAPKLNLAYDVFRGSVTVAPSSYARRLSDMQSVCEEVALRWPTVQPPEDYDGPPIP